MIPPSYPPPLRVGATSDFRDRWLWRDKRAVLGTVNLKLERLRYLIRMSKDLQLLSLHKYEYVAREMNEVGAMLGGWLKQQRSREP